MEPSSQMIPTSVNPHEITTLAIIPDTSCDRSCPYCYENHRKYGDSLTEDNFIVEINKVRASFPAISEVIVDYNLQSSTDFVKRILHGFPYKMDRLVVGTPRVLDGTTWNDEQLGVSIHDLKDITDFEHLNPSILDRVSYITLVPGSSDWNSLVMRIAQEHESIVLYVSIDKFQPYWKKLANKDYNVPELREEILRLIQTLGPEKIVIDNCLSTIMNNQSPCPAGTQVNLYRDGTIRRCPYAIKEQSHLNGKAFDKGCRLLIETGEKIE